MIMATGYLQPCRCHTIPAGKGDLRSRHALLEAHQVHGDNDELNPGWSPQQPGHRNGDIAHAVARGHLVDGGVELGELVASQEHAFKEAILKGRPCLDGNVIESAVIQHRAVAIHRRVKGGVDIDA